MWTTGWIKDICDWISPPGAPEPTLGEVVIQVGKTLLMGIPLIALAVGTIVESIIRAVFRFFGI